MPLFSFSSRLRPTRGATPAGASAAIQRWLVLHQGANPSTDYYVRPRLAATGLPVVYRPLDQFVHAEEDLAPGTGVVVVRYLNRAWAKALHRRRGCLAKVVYFMDDDLLRPAAWQRLPRAYVKKLHTHCGAFIDDIHRLANEFWFSSQSLADRYAGTSGRIVAPRALASDLGAGAAGDDRYAAGGPDAPVQLFYHGSASHRQEILWLHAIVERVLERCRNAHFEIVGDHEINARFRRLPRTRILHPMSWPNYLGHCRMLNGHIGLAPLLAHPFNDGRASVKALDIARCAAMGVYSRQGPYADVITHQENGLLLENDPDAWVQALCDLLGQPRRLAALRQAARGIPAQYAARGDDPVLTQ